MLRKLQNLRIGVPITVLLTIGLAPLTASADQDPLYSLARLTGLGQGYDINKQGQIAGNTK